MSRFTLLNLTAHASQKWGTAQRAATAGLFPDASGPVVITDWTFPRVNPAATTDNVEVLADDMVNEIALRYPAGQTCVHLMGEMTLVVALVARLQGLGYRVVASTTERIAEDLGDGERKLRFEFVGFREYGPLYTTAG